jgi:hypothetical protein
MAPMDDRPPDQAPGERRLERPPSDRYRPDPPSPMLDDGPSRNRGPLGAVVGAFGGAIAITIAGGLLAVTAGLLVIAAVLGWVVAAVFGPGSGPSGGPPAEEPGIGRGQRRFVAGTIAVAGVALGQLGLWLVARQEGGTLDLIAYLGEVFGWLVPAQLAIAGALAWWRTS